jgi:hypothetical protein
MIFDIIAFAILSSIIVLLLVLIIIQRKHHLQTLGLYIDAQMEKQIISEKFQELLAEKDLRGIEESDGFLKFLSESREWAFKYIEDVQESFKKFDNEIIAELDYADKYGQVDMDTPSRSALARVSKAYKELKQILPQDMVD